MGVSASVLRLKAWQSSSVTATTVTSLHSATLQVTPGAAPVFQDWLRC